MPKKRVADQLTNLRAKGVTMDVFPASRCHQSDYHPLFERLLLTDNDKIPTIGENELTGEMIKAEINTKWRRVRSRCEDSILG